MTWEWLGTVSTATVGLAGIVATFLTQERGRQAQAGLALDQDERKAQSDLRRVKRETYAKLVGALRSAVAVHATEQITDKQILETLEPQMEKLHEIVARNVKERLASASPQEVPHEIDELINEHLAQQMAGHMDHLKRAAKNALLGRLGYIIDEPAVRISLDLMYRDGAEVVFLSGNNLAGPVNDALLATQQFIMTSADADGMLHRRTHDMINRMEVAMLTDILEGDG